MLKNFLFFLIVSFWASSSHAATLIVSGGQLTGATGVDVGGNLYEVEFMSGTCQGIFDNCDSLSDFAFSTQADATTASQALLDQVFLDTGSGAFDTDPTLTSGCSFAGQCRAQTPYGFNTSGSLIFMQAINEAVVDYVFGPVSTSASSLFTFNATWAKWTPSTSAVPVPAAVWLFGTALIGLVGFSRRRKTA